MGRTTIATWMAGLMLMGAVTPTPVAFAAADVEIPEAMLGIFVNPSNPPLGKRIDTPDNPATPEKIDLGRMLYYDTRFSMSQKISCNSCHLLDRYGVDGEVTSPGHKGQRGSRNSPTVYNAAGHYAQFWDGRAKNVEEQALGPVLNPVEMAMPDEQYVLKVLRSIPGYVEAFKKAFPDEKEPISYPNFGKAIGAFERGLTTPNSPWDKFLAGDKNALTPEQKQGFMTFLNTGCITCHMGTHIGGNMPQKVGLVIPWPNQQDKGRFDLTKNPTDMMFFKSSSLRNVAKTAPYFHDGSVKTLDEAVKAMARHQLGRQITDEQANSIVAWLESLTGELPLDYIKKPELPASGPDTPGPKED